MGYLSIAADGLRVEHATTLTDQPQHLHDAIRSLLQYLQKCDPKMVYIAKEGAQGKAPERSMYMVMASDLLEAYSRMLTCKAFKPFCSEEQRRQHLYYMQISPEVHGAIRAAPIPAADSTAAHYPYVDHMHADDKAQLQYHYPQPPNDQATDYLRNAVYAHAKALEEHKVALHPGFHRVSCSLLLTFPRCLEQCSQITGPDLAEFALRQLSQEQRHSLMAKRFQIGKLPIEKSTLTLGQHVDLLNLRLKLQRDPTREEIKQWNESLWEAIREQAGRQPKKEEREQAKKQGIKEARYFTDNTAIDRLMKVYKSLHG